MAADFSARTLVSKKEINQTTCWLTFEGTIDAQPGQFVMAWVPGMGEKPFSIADLNPFSLLAVNVGPVSQAMHQMNPGDTLWIKGPLGQGYQMAGKHPLLVGGGYGAAPLLSLAKMMLNNGLHPRICLGARNEGGLLLVDAFTQCGCEVACATEDGSHGITGLVTQIVESAYQDVPFDGVYACGPNGMLSALAGFCRKNQVNYQLSWEAHMRCGMGLCGSCEVPVSSDPSLPVGWLACYDGPVFNKVWRD